MSTVPEIDVQDIDHLGIIAGIVDEIGIVEIIDGLLGVHEQEQVSCGQVVKALILNCMGFLTSPLYLLSQFFQGKATEHLIGPGVRPEHLNDSRIGRVLDKIYVYGVTEIFVRIAMSVVEKFDIRLKSGHLDATSLSVSGQYLAPETATSESETAEGTQAPSQTAQGDVCEPQDVVDPEEDMLPIAITYGYSRDHRSDLKQFVMDLIVSGDGDVPLFMQVCDGNQTDKSTFVGFIERFQSQWQQAPPEVFVADAALYSADNLAALGTTPWISRVPASLSAAGFLLQTLEPVQFQPSGLRGYSIVEVCNTYGGIRQRWLVVESQARKEADLKQLQKTLERASSDQSAALATLCAQSFACEADALNAAQAWSKTLKYHTLLNVHIEAKAHYAKAGRPVHGSSPTHYTYHIQATLELNEAMKKLLPSSVAKLDDSFWRLISFLRRIGVVTMFCANTRISNRANAAFALSKTLYFSHPVFSSRVLGGLWPWQ